MELRIEYTDLEIHGFDLGGTEIIYYQGQPFTGIETVTQNGILCGEREFQNGYRHGIQRDYFYPSGKLQEELTLIENSLHDTYREWDEQGNLISITEWVNGEKIFLI